MWRIVSAGYGTLREIEQEWSVDDLLDAHEVLDANAEIDATLNPPRE